MKTLEAKQIAILAENQYEDLELWYPKFRLAEEGAVTTVVAPEGGVYRSKHGYPVKADAEVEKLDPDGFDAVVIPGGFAPDFMRRDPRMIRFLEKAAEFNRVIAAICHGGWMLISANIIRGKHVTGFHSIKNDLVNAGGIYEDSPVVRDEKLITSRMPSDLPVFCSAIIQALQEAPVKV